MNKNCAGCGKPVYFAERKTSLGREWHPSCLKCTECRKVLAPGQHAEHKGMPYCHHPCYRALFGPAILGYGSNISSPANFGPRKDNMAAPSSATNRASTGSIPVLGSVLSEESLSPTYSLGRRNKPKHHLVHQNMNGVKNLAKGNKDLGNSGELRGGSYGDQTKRTASPSTPNAQRSTSFEPMPSTKSATLPLSSLSSSLSSSSSSSFKQHAPPPSPSQPSSESSPSSSPAFVKAEVGAVAPARSNEGRKLNTPLQEMLVKLEEFNKYYEGKVHHQMRAEQGDDGSVFVEGPLRVYWGLSRPIQLAHCDNIPPAPISQWRHSLHVSADSPVDSPNRSFASMSLRRTGSPARKSRDLDDLLSPTSSDDVVRRKKGGVRKFKTVAYRGGDQPSKWKRASINGHIFNFDTSVFTPVLGSCTSVTVDGTLNSLEVIETLLDKFKVQNSADEYVLSIVNEEGERLLTNRDRPLLERLKLGPDETVGKIFIKEREVLHEKGVGELVVSANVKASLAEGDRVDGSSAMEEDVDGGPGLVRSMRSSSIKMPIRETEEEENLPHEVEQLLILPEPVLKGLLVKYHNDEELEVKKIRARYDVFRQRMTKRIDEILSNSTSSTA